MAAALAHLPILQPRRRLRLGAAVLAAILWSSVSATAQTRGCTVTPFTDPPRQVLSCAGGVTVSAEARSAYRLLDRNGDGRPDGAELTSGGLLIEAPPRRGGFQILTPHAIASVRGTVWAVDVVPRRTSVFVQTGVVAVQRPQGQAVTLRAGDGVDVDADGGPLDVKQWGRERAAGLLARFGR
ncbi:FecR domain-containing protein [Methylobacterium nigriterrae]|uniref:FecR domain-containing protein n=1 Tax=Methylobacterium nigriterrae TaxID=3127512 RepID=UPI003013B7EB